MARMYRGVNLDSGPTTRPVRKKPAPDTTSGPPTRPVRKKPAPATKAVAAEPAPKMTKKPVPRPAKGPKKRSDGAYRDKYGEWHGPGGDRK